MSTNRKKDFINYSLHDEALLFSNQVIQFFVRLIERNVLVNMGLLDGVGWEAGNRLPLREEFTDGAGLVYGRRIANGLVTGLMTEPVSITSLCAGMVKCVNHAGKFQELILYNL